MKLEVHPLTEDRWADLVNLFSRPGASIVRGCWCMYYRRSGASSHASPSENKKALQSLVGRGYVPGLIGYQDGSPVGWISLGPRKDYAKLQRSPVMKPVDDKPTWSIVCFFVDPRARGRGVACVPARDRVRLERLCRYTARPPLALERLSLLPDGRLLYRLKRRWRNGTTHVIFEPLELVEKVAS